ncbi:MAG: hypothetical protein ACE37M_01750 [Henriciella sp.]
MSDRQEIIAYWLVPADQDAARFQAVVDALADQQGAPRFRAHLSFGSVIGEEPELGAVLEQLSGLTLNPIEIAQTPSFTMSLFVRFAPTEPLLGARKLLEESRSFQSSRDFDPHISLAYGEPKDLGALKPEMDDLLQAPVRFDWLIATSIWLPVETYADIARWKQRSEYQIP